jgi:hypothetical protein
MPHWKKQEQCFEDEKIEVIDSVHKKRRVNKDGSPVIKPWPHDKPVSQLAYENWLEKVVNPDTNQFYSALNKEGNPIKGTGPKHTVHQIIRFRRKNGSEWLYSTGEVNGYDAFGNVAQCTLYKPETWKRTLFTHERIYDQRTNTTKVRTTGTEKQEDVYELQFNESNLKLLFSKRVNDNEISFVVKDELEDRAVSLLREPSINDTLKLFMKPFNFLYKAEYISKEQRLALRQASIDAGLIPPSTPLVDDTEPAPPKEGTYS